MHRLPTASAPPARGRGDSRDDPHAAARPPGSPRRRGGDRVAAAAAAVFLAVLLAALAPGPAMAGYSVEIAPAQVEITLEPGASSTQTIGVRNHDTEPIELRVFVVDFELTSEGGFEMREPGHSTYSGGRWVAFPVSTLTLAADETRLLEYDIDVPADAEPGGHYAAIVFEGRSAAPDPAGGETELAIVGQVVAQVLITVPGRIDRDLVIESLKVPRIAFGAGADYADVTVRNTGNVHVTPNGYVQTWGGIPSGSFDAEFGQFTLLPGASRHFRVRLEDLPWLGRMRAKTELQYGPSIGVFDTAVESSADFFVISWKAIVILDLLLIGFDIVLFREWRRRVAAARLLGSTSAPAAGPPGSTPPPS